MKKCKSPIPQARRPAASTQVNATLLMTAYALHQQGRIDQAEKIYRDILRTQPRHLDALQLLARIALQKKEAKTALELFNRALALVPDDPAFLSNRGNALFELQRYAEALASYDLALKTAPADPEIIYNRGNALRELKRHEEALACYDLALKTRPDDVEALYNRSNTLFALKRHEEALASYDRTLTLRPNYAEALYNRGNALVELKKPKEALASYDQALALKPDYVEAHNNRGNALCELKLYEEALASCEQALKLRPDYADALVNRSNALLGLNRPLEALASCEQALKLKPEHVDALTSHGNALHRLQRVDEALLCYELVLKIQPDNVGALTNRSNVFLPLNRHEEALAGYDLAQKIKPNQADAHWNEALYRLLLGDFDIGWRKYEWRWQSTQTAREFSRPMWLGETSLAGKTILLHAEQGFGDTLQFCRYAPMVVALGARVVLEVQPALKSLCQSLAGVDVLLGTGEALPDFAVQTPLLSLPLAFGTSLETIPAEVPYLRAAPEKIAAWHELLEPKERLRVGLAWSGNPKHKNDHNRSLPLAQLTSLLAAPFEFICLQKDFRDQAEEQACRQSGLRIFNEELTDFADTAALVMNLDLVISVDTSIAHLAGALGKPVWILLPFAPDFRWLLERSDSPWYPSARLFRQREIGKWDAVLAEIVAELEEWCRAQGKS